MGNGLAVLSNQIFKRRVSYRQADLEIRDTADLEVCATRGRLGRSLALPCFVESSSGGFFGILCCKFGILLLMDGTISVRMDKWLWAARVFKTRSLATDACRHGHVTIGGLPVKPARDVRVGEIIVVRKDEITRQYKVLQLLEQRVGAPKAAEFAEDQTSPEELQKRREPNLKPYVFRPKGAGRPTKKERREIDKLSF